MSWGSHNLPTIDRIRACAVLFAALAATVAHADPLTVEWAIQFEAVEPAASGPANVFNTTLANDADGNLYVLGAFTGTIDFDPSPETMTLTSVEDGELVLAKLDPEGALLWALHFESSVATGGHIDSASTSLAVDPTGNIHIAGSFTGRVDMDPGPATTRLTSVGALGDGFVLKLDPEGEFLWARHLIATEADIAGIAVDATGNVALAGSFFGAIDVDPSPEMFTLNSLLGTSHFVCQWDSEGAFLWANHLLATSPDSSAEGQAVAVDAAGNVYTAGAFQYAVEFETDPEKAIIATSTSTFLAKFDPAGAVAWLNQFNQSGMDDGAYALEVDLDDADNPVLTGVFTGGIDADPSAAAFTLSTDLAAQAQFTIKLDPAGNLQWATQLPTTGLENAVVTSSATNPAGKVYTVGQFEGTLDFDPTEELFERTANGEADAYIRVLNANGAFDTATSWGGATADAATQVLANANEEVYVLGTITGPVDFDLGPGVATLIAPAEGHTYIAKLSPAPCEPPAAPTNITATDGTNIDAVEIAWDAVAGAAIEYQVLRSTTNDVATATPVSEWIDETTYDDTTADAPTPGPLNCSGVPIPTFHTYYYWVRAREIGAFCASEPSNPDPGYRGTPTPITTADTTAILATLALLLLAPTIPKRRTKP